MYATEKPKDGFPRRYVSVDIETTGLDEEVCQVIEIGAVIEDWTSPVEDLPAFHCYVVHNPIVGEPYALSMHQKIFRRIATREPGYDYLEPAEVGPTLKFWLEAHGFDTKKPVIPAGKNFASFDRPRLYRLPGFNRGIKFHRRTIDPATLFWNPLVDQELPGTETCLTRAGLDPNVPHEAVDDARNVIRLVRFGMRPRMKEAA
jgi:hypothetical protein